MFAIGYICGIVSLIIVKKGIQYFSEIGEAYKQPSNDIENSTIHTTTVIPEDEEEYIEPAPIPKGTKGRSSGIYVIIFLLLVGFATGIITWLFMTDDIEETIDRNHNSIRRVSMINNFPENITINSSDYTGGIYNG